MKNERTHHGTMDKSYNRNNRSVLVHRYSVLEKTGPILLLHLDLMAGREGGREGGQPANEMWVDFEIFKFYTG